MSPTSTWYFIQWVHFLALSLWIGGITSVAAITAPVTRRSMASKAVAAEIVGKILRKLNSIELCCCLLLIATSFSSLRFLSGREDRLLAMITVISAMGLIACYYTFYLTPRLGSLRERIPTLDTLAPVHPAKIEFNRLHRFYVKMMCLNLVLGLAVLYASVVIFK